MPSSRFFNARKEISRREFRRLRREHAEPASRNPGARVGSAGAGDRARPNGRRARTRMASRRFSSSSRRRTDCWSPPASVTSISPSTSWRTCRRNEPALGFDLRSEEKRRLALERARDTGLADGDAADPAGPGAGLSARLSRPPARLRSVRQRRSKSGGRICGGSPSPCTASAISWTRRCDRP